MLRNFGKSSDRERLWTDEARRTAISTRIKNVRHCGSPSLTVTVRVEGRGVWSRDPREAFPADPSRGGKHETREAHCCGRNDDRGAGRPRRRRCGGEAHAPATRSRCRGTRGPADKGIEKKVDDLVKQMTLEEKLNQLQLDADWQVER